MPAVNILATEVFDNVPIRTMAALGGIIGPMMLDAAVMPAAKAGS